MVKIIIPVSKKRPDPPETLDGPHIKKQKMDTGIKTECRRILKTLMTHKWGSIFNKPVDPVELRIPDYFTIITHPMDLGTIGKKLDDDKYASAEAFCSDIKLTFTNAMRYNPPENYVHLMAKELNDNFGKSWKLLETKLLKLGIPKKNVVIPNKIHKPVKESSVGVSLNTMKPEATDTVTTSSEVKPKPILSCAEKARLKNEFLLASRGDLSGPLRGFLRKYGLVSSKKEKIESVFGSFSDHTLIELKRVMKGCSGTSIEKNENAYVKTPQTKEVSLRQKPEENSNIESRIRAARAAKEALLQSAKSELQMKRNKEREQVEKMERTVTVDDNLAVLMELEKLCQYSGIKNPLEKLGLRLKEEYYYGYEYIDEDDDVELEDGEIL